MFLRTFLALLRLLYNKVMGQNKNASFDSRFMTDRVIQVYTGSSPTVSKGDGVYVEIPTTDVLPEGERCIWVGLWSKDGTNWVPIGGPTFTSGYVTEWLVTAQSDAGKIILSVANVRDDTARSIQYKVAIMLKDNNSVVRATNLPLKPSLDSRYTFQKIAFSGFPTVSVGASTTSTTTITHNLGYVPVVRAFLQYVSNGDGVVLGQVFDMATSNTPNLACYIKATDTDVSFVLDNSGNVLTGGGTFLLHYRIYYDD